MAELEKVIKAIETHISTDDSVGCDDCTYENDGWCMTRVLADALKLLNEYKQLQGWAQGNGLTKCKDCKWRGNKKKCIIAFLVDKKDFPLFFYDNRGEWFCADGERGTDA